MKIPLFPLDIVLFPGAVLPLHIFEERYKEMIGECIDRRRAFGVVRAQRDGLAVVGCTAQIVRLLEKYADGRMDILCQGRERFEIESLDSSRSFLQAEVDLYEDHEEPAGRLQRQECVALHFEALDLIGSDGMNPPLNLDLPVSFQLAWSAPSDLGFKQELLATRSDAERTTRLVAFYQSILPKLRSGAEAGRAAIRNGHIM